MSEKKHFMLFLHMCLALLVGVLISRMPVCWAAGKTAGGTDKTAVHMDNQLLIMTGQTGFSGGTFSGTELDDQGNITLQRAAGQKKLAGVYISPVIHSHGFTALVMSWNADTPQDTAVTVEARVFLDKQWTPWVSWGCWSSDVDSGSSATDGLPANLAMDTDTLFIKNGQIATALQYRVRLESKAVSRSPSVRLAAVTVHSLAHKPLPVTGCAKKMDVTLDVPQFSQKLRDPKIAGRICSPTSVSMILNYYGIKVQPEEAAWGVMDYHSDLFGNWSFNCAYAGCFGLRSYVVYYDSLEDVRQDILAGRPVAASVMYRRSETVAADLPVLHNAPIEATQGHLVVIRGFVQKDGKEYVVVNDPAAYDNQAVKRLYLAKEFEAAWTKVAYIVEKDTDAVSQPKRIPAVIQYTGDMLPSKSGVSKSKAFLVADGQPIDLSPGNVRTILIVKPNGETEFLQSGVSRALWLNKQEKGSSVIAITHNHKVYQAVIH